MKLAIVSLYLPGGKKTGVGYQVHYFANQMVERGHDVTVFSQNKPGPDARYNVKILARTGGMRTFWFAWDLRRENFAKFDILHSHGDDWFLWGIDRPRHVRTYHTSYLAEMSYETKSKEKLKMLTLAFFERLSSLLCDRSVVVSESIRRFLPGITSIVSSGVDLNVFKPGPKKSKDPAILFVGSRFGQKRGDLLVRTFLKEVRQSVPNAQLWMVCEEKVTGPGVLWFGRPCLPLLCELYRRAWVFCMPSSYEAFGVPYVEAMASGTAVVATPNDGAIEVTKSGKYGLLAPDEDLASSLIRVIQDLSLRQMFERVGLERATEFSWDSVCSQYEKLYADGFPVPGGHRRPLQGSQRSEASDS